MIDYLKQLVENKKKKDIPFLEGVHNLLAEHFSTYFKKSLATPFSFSLDLIDHTYSFHVEKQIHQEIHQDELLLFKQPAELTATFCLSCKHREPSEKFALESALATFFFDNSKIGPYVPASIQEYPLLCQAFRNRKATLKNPEFETRSQDSRLTTYMKFSYVSLFHSGLPLRKEKRVQTRSIQFDQTKQGRITQ